MTGMRIGIVSKLEWGCVMWLAFTGMAKLVSAFGHGHVLSSFDPVFEISNRLLFLLVGTAEVGLATRLLDMKRRGSEISGWLAGFAGALLLYRCFMYFSGFSGYCDCLGSLTGDLGISSRVASNVL